MSTLAVRLSDLTTRIATECKSIRTLLNGNAADLSALNTTAKSNLVAALNEIKSNIDNLAMQSSGVVIDDTATNTSETWSSSKISSSISTATGALINDSSASATTTYSSNEINSAISTATGALINDTTPSTTTAYSSSKTNAAIAAAVAGTTQIDDTKTNTTETWSSSQISSQIATKPSINDSETSSTTETWSITQISDSIANAITALTNGAPAALDTLKELADAINDDASFASTITASLSNRVRFDAAQSLTAAQMAQAKSNIDAYGNLEIGNPDTDFVSIFNSGL